MTGWLKRLWVFVQDEEGPTAVEYAVMLAFIIAICMASIGLVGQKSSSNFNGPKISSALAS